MSWNNVIPAWALFPVRVVGLYSDGKRAQKGFNTLAEAENWCWNEGDHLVEYQILQD